MREGHRCLGSSTRNVPRSLDSISRCQKCFDSRLVAQNGREPVTRSHRYVTIVTASCLCLNEIVEGGDMAEKKRDLLETLKFELKFLESGGYRRSARTPWRASNTFQDSPTCLNFNDPTRSHPCSKCLLLQFVPVERRTEELPCWFIPLTAMGETVKYYANCGTQLELEEALAAWLRDTIKSIELNHATEEGGGAEGKQDEISGVEKP